MISINNKAQCSGCSSCANICPFQCISMEEDREGFLYPKVDKEKCRQCGLCEAVCLSMNKPINENNNTVIGTYACIHKDEEVRLCSSSGGIFSLLAEDILKQNGIVYGVAMSKDCYGAEFIRVDDINRLYHLRGSKYLQAEIRDTYKLVKEDLENGLLVLFSGTGCQINGLKLFLKSKYDNLYCVDMICHGVPSPALWRKYVQVYEKQYGKLKTVNFRCKDKSWIDFGMKEDSLYISKDKDSYMQMFLNNYCLRPSCYECISKEIKMSDMTIADFWGIEDIAPEMEDGKGTSLVLIRTEKGRRIFNHIRTLLILKKVTYEEGIKKNPAEFESPIKPIQRDTFFDDMNIVSFDELERKYLQNSSIGKVRKLISRIFNGVRIKFHRGGVESAKNNEYGLLLKFELENYVDL